MGTIADFLGIELNSSLIQIRLPSNKLARARKTCENLLNKVFISYQELESAVRFLSFAAKIIIPGRAFLRRLFDSLRTQKSIYRITPAIKTDLY